MLCLICQERPVYCKQKCHRCYHYRRWTGIQRPIHCYAKSRPNDVDIPHPCQDCQMRPIYAKGVCQTCYNYLLRTGHLHTKPIRPFRSSYPRFCIVCFIAFSVTPSSRTKCCSRNCHMILQKTLLNNPKRCRKCTRIRPINSRQMCRPCYVYTRFKLTKGYTVEFPRCAIRIRSKTGIGI